MILNRQTFLVLGLSRSGTAAAEFLLAAKAKVYIYDDLDSEALESAMRALEKAGAERMQKEALVHSQEICDALVLSPGIPVDHPIAIAFKRNGKAVLGETELAARYMRCPIVAVTGTNGKTTTVSMIGKIFSDAGIDTATCGNIGTPMISKVGLSENAVAVAEISSFQLETLASLRPHVGIVLNITEDHLNRHYNMENYIFLKGKLLKNSAETEYAVLNYDDAIVRGFTEKTKARVVYFSARERVNGAYYENGTLYYAGEAVMPANDLPVDGIHNIRNALAAICAAKLMGISSQTIARSLSSFKGVKHRVEQVAEVNGVRYIDDSKGTNADATLQAVKCMKTETVLLLGGKDKGYDYDALFSALPSSKIVHAVLYGENRFRLFESARRCGFDRVTVSSDGFDFAVRLASLLAKKGQTVLLSPAAASFDEFADYEERGERFVAIVREMEKEGKNAPEDSGKSVVVTENAVAEK